jgi:carbamoyltransferase
VRFERLLKTYLAFAPRGFASFRMALPLWLKQKLFQKDLLGKRLKSCAPDFDWEHKLLFAEHHQSHAAARFLSNALRRGADPHHGWCGRMDHYERRKSAEITALTC